MDFQHKIHEEILQTLERRSKIDMTKLSFVIAFFSGGVIGEVGQITFFGTLYIAPFIALLCDCFIMREVWSLRRMGHYLRYYGSDEDRAFENFIGDKRNPFYPVGCAAITFIIISASIWMLSYQKQKTFCWWIWNRNDWLWVALSFICWAIIHIGGRLIIRYTFERGRKTKRVVF